MANAKKVQPVQSLLSALVREAGHDRAADKLEVQNALYRVPESGQHTELSEEEIALQSANVLDYPDEIKAVQAIEYNTFVAAEDIFHLGALAYAVNHPVPVSNVEKHRYDEIGAVRRIRLSPVESKATDEKPAAS